MRFNVGFQSRTDIKTRNQAQNRTGPKMVPGPIWYRTEYSPPGLTDDSHLPAGPTATEELIAAIGLEARDAHALWHLDSFQDLARSRIDLMDLAVAVLSHPQCALGPGKA